MQETGNARILTRLTTSGVPFQIFTANDSNSAWLAFRRYLSRRREQIRKYPLSKRWHINFRGAHET